MGYSILFSFHAAVSLLLPQIPILFPGLVSLTTLILAIYAPVFFAYFYFGNQIKPYKPADGITAGRLFLALFILFGTSSNYFSCLIIFLLILFVEALDGLDGYVARKTGTTRFGAVWDMETDAFVILILSYISVFYLNYPWWILGFGMIRYLFYFLYYNIKPDKTVFPKNLSRFSKTICVSTVLVMALFWVIPTNTGIFLGLINLLLLIVSFLWEGSYYLELRSHTKNL